MSYRSYERIDLSDHHFRAYFHLRALVHTSNIAISRTAVILLVLLFLPQIVYFQPRDDFGVKMVIRNVKKQFRLNARDLNSLVPLIDQANRNVVEIYVRFSGDEPEYSARVWEEIISRRREFDSGIRPELSTRQRSALRFARTAMEQRILNYLVQDFVSFLGDILELRDWEFNEVLQLFETERDRKYQLVTVHLSDLGRLQVEMEKVDQKTESVLKRLLSSEQWRGYRDLTETAKLIALLHP